MNAKVETSLTKAADPVAVFMSSNCSRQTGSVAFNGLENRGDMLEEAKSKDESSWQAKPNLPFTTEAKDAPPVAGGMDSTPTNWFELAADLCLSGRITETRMGRAIDAVKQGVDRA